jgi:hypothetical protein
MHPEHMKNKYTIVSLITFICLSSLSAQDMGKPRTNDWRFRWNMGQFAAIGRYAFQFGLERDIADNKTLSGELGLSFYRGGNNTLYQRYNYNGIQGLVEYRNYFKGFHDSKVKPYMGLGIFARQLSFDADVTLGYGIKSTRDWNSATFYENTSAHYKTFTGRLHAIFGFRAPISPTMYFEASGGPAFGYYSINNDVKRNSSFVIDNFNNPFFMSSQPGSYFSPALYGSVEFGFVIAKAKAHQGSKP